MRIAFVDLLFSWPPHGGADVDLYHVLKELLAAGNEVCLFGVNAPATWERGAFEPRTLPFPAVKLMFPGTHFNRHSLPARIREAVDTWKPDAVFIADGFFLKPYVILALAHYPLAARYYAYEAACHRSILRYKNGAPCPNHYLQTPEECRRCALGYLRAGLKQWHTPAWTQEYLAAHAYAPEYHRLTNAALRCLRAAVVYNPLMQQDLQPYCDNVLIVPGGVDATAFAYSPAPPDNKPVKTILMTGRGEDPVKGLSVLLDAGQRLARIRRDFVIQATVPPEGPSPDWFKPLSWRDHAQTATLYRDADICVTPSVWEEPFGLVALEAMATGRPVCASRVGGLQHLITHGENGFLFERGNGAALAAFLERLLDDGTLRRRMGDAARQHVDAGFTWERVVARYYAPVLEALCR